MDAHYTFGDSPEAIADAVTQQLLQMEEIAKQKQSSSAGGAMRTVKGKFVEDLCDDLVRLSWHSIGGDETRLSLSRKKVPIPARHAQLEKTESGEGQAGLYRCKVDKHYMIDEELALAFECKSYAENAMLKRIMVDFFFLRAVYPNISCFLLQLESQLGGNYSSLAEEHEQYSSSSAAIMSHFPNVDLKILTLIAGERKIDKPIHTFPKPLLVDTVKNSVRIIGECMVQHCDSRMNVP